MKKGSKVFVGIDTAKAHNAVAVAEAGRDGEGRYLGTFDNTLDTQQRVSPVEHFDGTRPRNAMSWRGCSKRRRSPASATIVTAVMNCTPRIARNAWTTGAIVQPGTIMTGELPQRRSTPAYVHVRCISPTSASSASRARSEPVGHDFLLIKPSNGVILGSKPQIACELSKV